ncbi:uncharacterized protein [Spinacia oleracea]|uniref:Reverse transcriptase domain-containing protein n=1 Tax=Spinacia oleracea TaxID=3562 RepID=A0ABM3QX59_SPIOL|nr:uncharacterized protein LOC130462973 [Spinacia oleracea]
MGRPRKNHGKSSGKQPNKNKDALTKPITRASSKNTQTPLMADDDAISDGVESGHDICTHFSSNLKFGGNGGNGSKIGQSHNGDPVIMFFDDNDEHIHANTAETVVIAYSPVPSPVTIDLEDIEDEIAYWQSAVVCYVLGANRPQHVMEGFVHRICGKMGVEKVALIGKGIYVIRFTTMENSHKILQGNAYFFDKKPLIVKPWSADVNYAKDPVKQVPLWIKLPGLDVKYWGEKSLFKIAGQVGKAIRVDQATKNRDKLMFAKRRVWVPKQQARVVNAPTQTQVDGSTVAQKEGAHDVAAFDGFVQATSFSKQQCQRLKPVNTRNSFQILNMDDYDEVETVVDDEILLDQGKAKKIEVRRFIHTHKIKLVSLLETKVKRPKLGDLYLNVCPGWNFTTNVTYSTSGRIILAWDPNSFTVNIESMSSQYIHCFITPKSTGTGFFGTFIYGMNDMKDRIPLWNALCQIADHCNQPWVIMGDFNALMDIEDRVGAPVRIRDIQPMRSCMAYCNQFTWNNKQVGEDRVLSRIDRVLATTSWTDLFRNVEAHFLPEGMFYNCPMVMKSYIDNPIRRPFRFYNMWTCADKFFEVVHSNWLKQQANLHANPGDVIAATEEKQAAEAYKSAHQVYMSFLQRTAKIQWLEKGDENSRLFHQGIKQRRQQNTIHSIQDMHGNWVGTPDGVKMAFSQFFKDLFCNQMDQRCHVNTAIMNRGPRLNDVHKSFLDCNFTMDDIKVVLWSIPNHKAPGLDGYNSQFYKATWHIVKDDLHKAITDFFQTDKILKELNVTSITLIPKVSVPASVSDFRPIACCNVIYKCISKLICIKLSQDLIKMYYHSQTQPCCLMKVDIRKAYDTVEWSFIEEVMLDLGFPPFFVQLIMTCLSTTRYSIINGEPTDLIQPRRGLRQGGPLSPLLFTLCMEYFSRSMKTVGDYTQFKLHKRCRSLQLNHFMLC